MRTFEPPPGSVFLDEVGVKVFESGNGPSQLDLLALRLEARIARGGVERVERRQRLLPPRRLDLLLGLLKQLARALG